MYDTATCFAMVVNTLDNIMGNNNDEQRAILGSGCITLIVAALMLLCAILCAILDRI